MMCLAAAVLAAAPAADDCVSISTEQVEARRSALQECLDRGASCVREAQDYGDAKARSEVCAPDAGPRRAPLGEAAPPPAESTAPPAPVAPIEQPPAPPSSKAYGSQGVLEVGVGAALRGSSTSLTANARTVTSGTTNVDLSGTIGYFVADSFELIGGTLFTLNTASASDKSALSQQTVDLIGGASYLYRVSDSFHIGPLVYVDFSTLSQSSTSNTGAQANVNVSGPFVHLQLSAKVPIRGAALLSAGIGYATSIEGTFNSSTAAGSVTGSESRWILYTSVGIGFFL